MVGLSRRSRAAKKSIGNGSKFGDATKNSKRDITYYGTEMALLLMNFLSCDETFEGGDVFSDMLPDADTQFIEQVLKWNPAAETKVVRRGDSKRSQERHKTNLKLRRESVAEQPRLQAFGFVAIPTEPIPAVEIPAVEIPAVEIPAVEDVEDFNVVVDAGESDDDDDAQNPIETPERMKEAMNEIYGKIKFINNKDNEKKLVDVSKYKYRQYLAVHAYFALRVQAIPQRKLVASRTVAEMLFPATTARSIFSYKARCIRQWAAQYLYGGDFHPSKQGRHPKTHSIIFDEGAKTIMANHLRAQPAELRTPQSFAADLNEKLLRTIANAPVKVCEQTARRWLFHLGYAPVRHGKNYYVDGHEREDVVAYRTEYLKRMEAIERRVGYWEGAEMADFVAPALQGEEKPLIFITHDESIFYSNESMIVTWEMDGFKSLRPKSKGRSLHVSGFCCPCHGFIQEPVDKAIHIIKPGKNHDGYWTNSDLVKQLETVIPLFERAHPGKDLIFNFDNSQNHHAKCADGLDASKLNLSDGGKNVVFQRDTTWNGQPFAMQHVVHGKLVQKGLKTILSERGEWTHTISKEAAMQRLQMHENFQQQREWLAETVQKAGHSIDYYPKFHCELNFIEMVWGHAKAKLRRRCTYNFSDMQKVLPETLHSMPVSFMRRVYRHCMRYMSGYRRGLQGPLLDYALKKFKGHRTIPEYVLAELEAEHNADVEKKKVKRELG